MKDLFQKKNEAKLRAYLEAQRKKKEEKMGSNPNCSDISKSDKLKNSKGD